jgi:DNA modification methylase
VKSCWYGMERNPKYVDVIVQRWEQLAGKKATLDGDGRAFGDVTPERRNEAA